LVVEKFVVVALVATKLVVVLLTKEELTPVRFAI
jgi:hypothetical protein